MRIKLIKVVLWNSIAMAALVAQPAKNPPPKAKTASTAGNPPAADTQNSTKAIEPKSSADLDEVVVQANTRVTGSKTDVPIHDTPASIITVPEEIIEEQMAVDMNSMVKNVSGVNQQLGGGYGFADSYTIRGLNMRFLRDGFADGAAFNGYMRTMSDVESIEVLKGPGSALYGRNEPGGAINITTKKPHEKFAASVDGLTGFWNTYRIAADVNAPLVNDKLLTRTIASQYSTDGYRGLARRITEILPTVTWKFNDKHSLTLDYDFRDIKTRPDNYGILFDATNGLSAGSPTRTFYSPFNTAQQTVNRISTFYEGRFNEHFRLRSTLIYDNRSIYMIRNGSGSANTTSSIGNVTNRDAREQRDAVDSILHQNEAVFKFKTADFQHTVLTGLEFEYIRLGSVRNSYSPLPAVSLAQPAPSETSLSNYPKTLSFDRNVQMMTSSIYAQEQVAFNNYLKARAGVRLDHVEASDAGYGSQPNVTGASQRTIQMSRDLVSWQSGLLYQPWQPVSFYTGYSEGRYVALNTEAAYMYTEPETSSQAEVGNKLSFFGDRFQTNLALFRTTRANYAYTDTSGNVNFVGGKRYTRGIELDISGTPLAGLWVIFNSALMDSEIANETTGTGINTVNLSGLTPQNIPQYAGSLWATYEIQAGFFKGLGFGGGPSYKSGVYADAKNLLRVPGYIIADAVLFYKRHHWQVQVNFKNITNEIYYTTPTFSGALPGEPFNFTVAAKARI
ncbi:MAG: TonB-dependent siderophore receptor [Spirochaetes bacterium]|nr:TonB-dependent siderophore receptor [Spirochaetota bacterium]